MFASIIHTDIFAYHTTTYFSLPFILHSFGILDFMWF